MRSSSYGRCSERFWDTTIRRQVGRRRIGYLLNLDRTTERQRLLVATAACMLYVLIRAVLTGSVSYFLLLVVLAADYFVYDRHERARKG